MSWYSVKFLVRLIKRRATNMEAITSTEGGRDLLTDLRLCGPQSRSGNSDREKLYCACLNLKIKWTMLDSS